VEHQFLQAKAWRYHLLLFVICSALSLPLAGQEPIQDEQQRWASFVLSGVSRLESLQAAESDLAESDYLAQAAGRPIYNPEFSADYEDKTDREFAVSLSQTLDWSGKRTARSRVGQSALTAAQFRLQSVRNSLYYNALNALNQYEASRQNADLSRQQVTLLEQLLEVAENRLAVGDLGALDAELARLSLSEAIHEAARADSELRLNLGLVESAVGATQVFPLPEFTLAQTLGNNTLDQLVENIPEVQEAKFQFLTARNLVDYTDKGRKADPTVSFGSGKDGNDSVLALSFSIPLNVRNRYSAEVSASNEAALAAELRYTNLRRVKLAELQASSESYRRLDDEWQRWKNITEQRFDQSRDLLIRLWESGDITTADYVFGLQQHVQAVKAGAEFEKDVFDSLIYWLETSGQTESWLETISQ